MPLPSQSIRPVTTSASSYRRRRKAGRGRLAAAIVLLGAAGAGAWWYWPESTPREVEATPTNASLNPESSPSVAQQQPERREEPVVEETAPPSIQPERPKEAPPMVLATDAPVSPPTASRADVQALLKAAESEFERGNLIEARTLFNRVINDERAAETDRALARARAAAINEDLIFSPKVYAGEANTLSHRLARGELLSTLVSSMGLAVHPNFLARINRLPSPDKVFEGQTLKLVRGPFHVEVRKRDFRMDVFVGDPEDRGSWTYIRSFPVGLGEADSTPVGKFRVKRGSKTVNPAWTNPLTNERFGRDDPKNPIGDYWIGIEGIGDDARYVGFGIHGTIEPESIGKMKSMGCVRLRDGDIELVFEMLAEEVSLVTILP